MQPNNLSLLAACHLEEKRHSKPFKLDQAVSSSDQQPLSVNQTSMITKDNYRGVPDEYRADHKSVPVKLRKRRLEEQQAFDNFCGCKKFTHRQHQAHCKHQKQEQSVPYSRGGDRLSPRGGNINDASAFMSNKTIAPFLQEDTT